MNPRTLRSLRLAVPAILGALALAFPAASLAQFDGSLDTAFDGPGGSGNGQFAFDFGATESGSDVVVQSNGRIVAVGTSGTDIAVARFNSNGSLDSTFDGPSGTGNGSFVYDPGAGSANGQAIALDSSGRILIAGGIPGAGMDLFLARLDPADGDFDTTFGGGDGIASASLSAGDDLVRELAIDSSDRIVVAGGSGADVAVARFTSAGVLDTSFDGPLGTGDGKFAFDIGGSSDVISDVAIQSHDQKIVVAGRASTGTGGSDFAAARLSGTDGSFDTTFDGPAGSSTTFPGNGKFAYPLTPGTGQDNGVALAIQGSKLLVGGEAGAGGAMALTRLNSSDGDLDSSFDGDGVVLTDLSANTDVIQDLDIDTKGRIVAVGTSFAPSKEFAALRYDANGVLDAFFDSDSGTANGAFQINVGASGSDGRSFARESDGDLVLVGVADALNNDFGLARLKVDLIEPNTLTTGPSGTIGNNNPVFSISSTETITSVQCTMDAAPVACTGGGGQQFGPFADGLHTLTAAAVDQSGNLDSTPATRSFTVDTTAPNTTIDSGLGLTNDSTPTIGFTANEAGVSFQCRIDPDGGPAGSFAACPTPFTPAVALPDGGYTLSVRTTDAVGNLDLSDATGTFTVDTKAPVAQITGGPPASVKTKKGILATSFAFSSDDAAATLECSLDGAAFAPCATPFGATLGKGSHTFSVRATDAAGNKSVPASRGVTVSKKKKKKRKK